MDLRQSLETTRAATIPSTEPLVASPDDSVRDCVLKLQERRKGCLLICDGDELVGIFTERDLSRRLLTPRESLDQPISKFMTPDPETLKPNDSAAEIVKRMIDGGYRHLPVVDEQGKVKGTISVKRLVRYLMEHFPATIYNQPPVSLHMQSEREGA